MNCAATRHLKFLTRFQLHWPNPLNIRQWNMAACSANFGVTWLTWEWHFQTITWLSDTLYCTNVKCFIQSNMGKYYTQRKTNGQKVAKSFYTFFLEFSVDKSHHYTTLAHKHFIIKLPLPHEDTVYCHVPTRQDEKVKTLHHVRFCVHKVWATCVFTLWVTVGRHWLLLLHIIVKYIHILHILTS